MGQWGKFMRDESGYEVIACVFVFIFVFIFVFVFVCVYGYQSQSVYGDSIYNTIINS